MTASLLETTASITNEKRTQRRRIENISMMDYLHKTQWSAAACEHSIWQRQRLLSAPVTFEKQWNRPGWLMSLNRALRVRRVEGGCWGSVGVGRKDEQTPNHKEARRRRNLKKWLVGLEFGMTSNQTGCQRVDGGGLNSWQIKCWDSWPFFHLQFVSVG